MGTILLLGLLRIMMKHKGPATNYATVKNSFQVENGKIGAKKIIHSTEILFIEAIANVKEIIN
jgi:hypothetical protein